MFRKIKNIVIIAIIGAFVASNGLRITENPIKGEQISEKVLWAVGSLKTVTDNLSSEEIVQKIEVFLKDSKIASEVSSNNKKEISTNNFSGDTMQVYFFDVGQGDSIYIKAPGGEDILIDGGDIDQGDRVVNYLKELQVDDIEVLIATHPHSDHIGGLNTVLDNFEVESVYAPKVYHDTKTYKNFLLKVKAQGLQINEAKAGINIPLQQIQADFVGPVKEYEDLNNASAVLKITYSNQSFLFTGDIEAEAEEDILKTNQNISATVLKVAHHGSNTSSTKGFLNKVSPNYAIISSGKENEYGHPTKSVLNNLKNTSILRTDQLGTIHIVTDGKNITREDMQ